MTHLLSQVLNFRRCNAGVPHDLELSAVVEALMEGWSLDDVEATADRGVSDEDRQTIGELITEHDLGVTPEECAAALLAECAGRAPGTPG